MIDLNQSILNLALLQLSAAAMLLFIRLDFRPPGERILKNLGQVVKNTEVVVFLVQGRYSVLL